ncbi:hypothetical protein [Streptomyces sp. NPDC127108]|uniref:hypothetical protein n=1 Tax=Streptomyces sp. NPDC127108 TaxID=3345361 RepID=UPI003645C3B9
MTPRVPYEAMAPHVPPVAPRPRAADPELPVFIDESGWRRRALQGVAVVVSCACVGYLVFVGTLMTGLLRPVGTEPPSTNGPVPAGPDSGERAQGPDAPGRTDADRPRAGDHRPQSDAHAEAGAHADRDHHRRPSTGRSVPPPAGGPRQ